MTLRLRWLAASVAVACCVALVPGSRTSAAPVSDREQRVGTRGAIAFWEGIQTASGERLLGPWWPNYLIDADFSPDGAALAWSGAGGTIFVTDGAGITRQIADMDANALSVRWSPDGTRLALSLHVGGTSLRNTKIAIVAVDGLSAPSIVMQGRKSEVDNVDWTADSKALLYLRKADAYPALDTFDTGFDLFRYDIASGTHTQVTHNCIWSTPAPPGVPDCTTSQEVQGPISVSPDGARLTYVALIPPDALGVPSSQLMVADVATGVSTPLVASTDPAAFPISRPDRDDPFLFKSAVWSPDGSQIAVAGVGKTDRSDLWQTWLVPSAGGTPRYLALSGARSWQACPTGQCTPFGTPPESLRVRARIKVGHTRVLLSGSVRPKSLSAGRFVATLDTYRNDGWQRVRQRAGRRAVIDWRGRFLVEFRRPQRTERCRVSVVAPAYWFKVRARWVKKFGC